MISKQLLGQLVCIRVGFFPQYCLLAALPERPRDPLRPLQLRARREGSPRTDTFRGYWCTGVRVSGTGPNTRPQDGPINVENPQYKDPAIAIPNTSRSLYMRPSFEKKPYVHHSQSTV